MIEPMEPRRLLSAAIDHGVLIIQGTRRADQIDLRLDGLKTLRVTVNGEETVFLRKRVGKIRILAGQGDDRVDVTRDDNFVAGVFVSGGAGDDSLDGGNGRDTLRGEDGFDLIYAGEGDDLVQGGGNSDSLSGEGGEDRLSGDTGDDEIDGGLGDDTLSGGRGDDTLHEEEGRDRLLGGAGHDTFYYLESPRDVRDEDAAESVQPEVVGSRFLPQPVIISSPGLGAGGTLQYVGGGGLSVGNIAWLGGSGLTVNDNLINPPPTSVISLNPPTTPVININPGGTLNLGGGSVSVSSGGSTSGGGLVLSGSNSFGGITQVSGSGGLTLNGGSLTLNPTPVSNPALPGGITVESGPLGDGAVLRVPAGSLLTVGSGEPQTIAAGFSITATGPFHLTTPSGIAFDVNRAWTLTLNAPADPPAEPSTDGAVTATA